MLNLREWTFGTLDHQVLIVSLMWLAFLTVLGFGLYWYQRNYAAPFSASMPSDEEARTIARQRLARGEISRQEFEELMREIG